MKGESLKLTPVVVRYLLDPLGMPASMAGVKIFGLLTTTVQITHILNGTHM